MLQHYLIIIIYRTFVWHSPTNTEPHNKKKSAKRKEENALKQTDHKLGNRRVLKVAVDAASLLFEKQFNFISTSSTVIIFSFFCSCLNGKYRMEYPIPMVLSMFLDQNKTCSPTCAKYPVTIVVEVIVL